MRAAGLPGVQLLAEGSSRVAHLDGLLDPRLRTLALGHAEALRDHHHLAETVGAVAVRTVLGEAVSAAQGDGEAGRSTFLEDASSALSSAVLATMASAVRDGVVARRTRDATGANALADANAHTRTVVPAMCNEAMLRFAGIDHHAGSGSY